MVENGGLNYRRLQLKQFIISISTLWPLASGPIFISVDLFEPTTIANYFYCPFVCYTCICLMWSVVILPLASRCAGAKLSIKSSRGNEGGVEGVEGKEGWRLRLRLRWA